MVIYNSIYRNEIKNYIKLVIKRQKKFKKSNIKTVDFDDKISNVKFC